MDEEGYKTKKGDYIHTWLDTGIDRGQDLGIKTIDLFTYNP